MIDTNSMAHGFYLADLERQVVRARNAGTSGMGPVARVAVVVAVLVVCVAIALVAGGAGAPSALG